MVLTAVKCQVEEEVNNSVNFIYSVEVSNFWTTAVVLEGSTPRWPYIDVHMGSDWETITPFREDLLK